MILPELNFKCQNKYSCILQKTLVQPQYGCLTMVFLYFISTTCIYLRVTVTGICYNDQVETNSVKPFVQEFSLDSLISLKVRAVQQ